MSLLNLPTELLIRIFDYLPIEDLINVELICKRCFVAVELLCDRTKSLNLNEHFGWKNAKFGWIVNKFSRTRQLTATPQSQSNNEIQRLNEIVMLLLQNSNTQDDLRRFEWHNFSISRNTFLALSKCQNLTCLKLLGVRGHSCTTYLIEGIEALRPNLTDLTFHFTPPHSTAEQKQQDQLWRVILRCPNLLSLSVAINGYTSHTLTTAEFNQRLKDPEYLGYDVACTQLRSFTSAGKLSPPAEVLLALSKCQQIEELQLNCQVFSYTAVMDLISQWTGIRSLQIDPPSFYTGDICVTSENLAQLLERIGPKIQRLRFGRFIKNIGCYTLHNIAKSCPKLLSLSFRGQYAYTDSTFHYRHLKVDTVTNLKRQLWTIQQNCPALEKITIEDHTTSSLFKKIEAESKREWPVCKLEVNVSEKLKLRPKTGKSIQKNSNLVKDLLPLNFFQSLNHVAHANIEPNKTADKSSDHEDTLLPKWMFQANENSNSTENSNSLVKTTKPKPEKIKTGSNGTNEADYIEQTLLIIPQWMFETSQTSSAEFSKISHKNCTTFQQQRLEDDGSDTLWDSIKIVNGQIFGLPTGVFRVCTIVSISLAAIYALLSFYRN